MMSFIRGEVVTEWSFDEDWEDDYPDKDFDWEDDYPIEDLDEGAPRVPHHSLTPTRSAC